MWPPEAWEKSEIIYALLAYSEAGSGLEVLSCLRLGVRPTSQLIYRESE